MTSDHYCPVKKPKADSRRHSEQRATVEILESPVPLSRQYRFERPQSFCALSQRKLLLTTVTSCRRAKNATSAPKKAHSRQGQRPGKATGDGRMQWRRTMLPCRAAGAVRRLRATASTRGSAFRRVNACVLSVWRAMPVALRWLASDCRYCPGQVALSAQAPLAGRNDARHL
jgi:hypothetical protein